jgi:hypothetical protein
MDPIAHNAELMRKADLALSDLSSGGLLNVAQAKNFFRQVIEEATFLKYARVKPMKSYTDNIDKINITGRVLKNVGAGTALPVADRTVPTLGQVQVVAVPYKAEIRLNDDILEDNIEQKRLSATVQNRMSAAISRDLEELSFEGDTTSANLFLASQEGLLRLITSNTVDAGGDAITFTDFEDAMTAMPHKYKKDRAKMRWITGHAVEERCRADVGTRATTLGDRALFEYIPLTPMGPMIMPSAMFPEDISSTLTACVLMDPKNFILGMWRDIKFEFGRDVSAGETIFVYSLRAGMQLEEEDASVEIHNVLA